MKRTLPILALASLPLGAIASDDTKSSFDIELGVISTSGNTETNSLKGKLDIKQELERVRNHYVLSGFYKEDAVEFQENGETVSEDRTTAEKYFASAQTDFKLDTEHKGLFLFGSYEEDKLSGFEYQGTLALGYSDLFFKTDNSLLKYNIGPGVAYTQTKDIFDADGNVTTEGESDSTTILRVALDFLYQISETAKFTQTVSSEIAPDSDKNTKTNAESALSASLTKGLALKVSYSIKYNSEVPEETKHADTQTAVTFVMSF